MIKNVDIKADVEPNVGFGEIKLGMNIFYFHQIFSDSFRNNGEDSKWKFNASSRVLVKITLSYGDAFTLVFNTILGKLCRIRLHSGYKGSLLGVKVGSKVKDAFSLLKVSKDGEDYDVTDGILTFHSYPNLWFSISSEYEDDLEYDEMKDRKIKRIEFFDRDIDYFPHNITEMSQEWKDSKPNVIGL